MKNDKCGIRIILDFDLDTLPFGEWDLSYVIHNLCKNENM